MPFDGVDFSFPEKLSFLLTEKAQYKVAHGGRGGGKSWSFAKAIIIVCLQKTTRVLCARELQNSLEDSAYKLLCDIIRNAGLEGTFFTIQYDTILGANGSEIRFMGIKNNPSKIKSFEGIDICWIMEAAKIAESSMDILDPTLRKPGCEVWIEFNPDQGSDYIYRTFVLGEKRPKNSIVVEINYMDNPWFWETELVEKMQHCKDTDPDKYNNVWLGKVKRVLTGAVYAEEMQAAIREGRITRVLHVQDLPVHCFFDLGWNDYTSIWFVQKIGSEYHFIDYLQDRMKPITHYLQLMQTKPYFIATCWLPHDATHKALGTGMSIQQIVKRFYKTKIVPKISITDGINAVRELFPRCYFDEVKVEAGITALCEYHWSDKDKALVKPVHDIHSNGADGFRYFAVCIDRAARIPVFVDEDGQDVSDVVTKRKMAVLQPPIPPMPPGSSWMR